MSSITVNIPKKDIPFFRKLSRKMGWSYSDNEKPAFDATKCDAYEEALKDIEEGRVNTYSSLEDFIAHVSNAQV